MICTKTGAFAGVSRGVLALGAALMPAAVDLKVDLSHRNLDAVLDGVQFPLAVDELRLNAAAVNWSVADEKAGGAHYFDSPIHRSGLPFQCEGTRTHTSASSPSRWRGGLLPPADQYRLPSMPA